MRVRAGAGRRGRWSLLALLLSLLLPLQSFAAATHCEHYQVGSRSAAHEHCAKHAGHDPATTHHACCAGCCLPAAVAAALEWHRPLTLAAEHVIPAPRAPLTIALDRLDRPPRHLA